jgi:YhcH/YjgK/YiaL family protein
MILDTLDNFAKYSSLHPLFSEVEVFLKHLNLDTLKEGKTELIPDKLYLIYEITSLREKEVAKLEVHKKYIDIQIPLIDGESMGWKSLPECKEWVTSFDEENDYGFFNESFESIFTVPKGNFALFFPQDAHAPLLGEGEIRKLVFKVKVSF